MGRRPASHGYVRQEEGSGSSEEQLYSVSSVERRRQQAKALGKSVERRSRKARELGSNHSNSLKRRQLKYNLAKYKLTRSGRKLRRRVESQAVPGPSEKVSSWHQDIFMVTPRRGGREGGEGGQQGGHPRSCVCSQCLAEFGTYRYYSRALREGRERKEGDRAGAREGARGQARSNQGGSAVNVLYGKVRGMQRLLCFTQCCTMHTAH